MIRESEKWGRFPVEVVRVEPSVQVTVTESGFAAPNVPDATRERARKDNTGGWNLELNSLKERAETS